MSKSALTIHREIEKKKHAESPLGQLERELGAFYDRCKTTGKKLPENLAKQVFDIRTENEKKVGDYIEERLKKDRDAVDDFLMDAMTRELAILKQFND